MTEPLNLSRIRIPEFCWHTEPEPELRSDSVGQIRMLYCIKYRGKTDRYHIQFEYYIVIGFYEKQNKSYRSTFCPVLFLST